MYVCMYVKNSKVIACEKGTLKSGEKKMILHKSISRLHEEWGGRVSLSKFKQLRPCYVITVNNNKFVSVSVQSVCLSVSKWML